MAVLVVLMLSACDTGEVFEAPSSQSECDQPGNVVSNCGFDVNLDDWQSPGSGVTHSSEDGSSKRGCAQIVSAAGGSEWFASIKQCVAFPSVATYAVGADIRVVTGSPDSCVIAIGGTDSCPSGTAGIVLSSAFNPSDSWSQSSPLVTDISVAWDAAVVFLQCRGTSAFTVRFDDAFVKEQ